MPFLLLLVSVAQAHRWVKATDARELARVLAFMREAYTGLDSDAPLPYFDRQGEPTVDVGEEASHGWRTYDFRFASLTIDVATGRIQQFGGLGEVHPVYYPEGGVVPRRVSDADASFLARQFLLASGRSNSVAITQVRDLAGDNDASLQVDYVPVAGGVRYEGYGGRVWLERQTGRLERFYPAQDLAPAPPASLRPALSLDAARAVALGSGAELRGEALVESPRSGLHLVVWTPSAKFETKRRPGATIQARSATTRAALAHGRGVLAYAGWLLGGSPASGVRVVVDAQTGEVLATQEPFSPGSMGGGGGGGPVADAKALAVPVVARPWRVAAAKGTLAGPVRAALVPVASPAPAGRPVTLTDGAVAFPAAYDAGANLLGVAGRAYRPGPALAALLRRKTKG